LILPRRLPFRERSRVMRVHCIYSAHLPLPPPSHRVEHDSRPRERARSSIKHRGVRCRFFSLPSLFVSFPLSFLSPLHTRIFRGAKLIARHGVSLRCGCDTSRTQRRHSARAIGSVSLQRARASAYTQVSNDLSASERARDAEPMDVRRV